MELTIKDFKKLDKTHMISNCGTYSLWDDKGFFYPSTWYYKGMGKSKETGNFWCNMVHPSYDYSRSFKEAVEVLNMVLNKTWKTGKGRYLNNLK